MKLNKISLDSIKLSLEEFPVLSENTFFIECLEQMTRFKIGTACIINKENQLIGVITDGDIRRNLISSQKMFSNLAVEYCHKFSNKNTIVLKNNDDLNKAIDLVIKNKIWDIPIVDNDNKLLGLLHLNNLLKAII